MTQDVGSIRWIVSVCEQPKGDYIKLICTSFGIKETSMDLALWVDNAGIAGLSVINTIMWFYTLKTVGKPALFDPKFLIKLAFNPYFILALLSALAASVAGYYVVYTLGVGAGRLFLSVGLVATVATATLLLGERLSNLQLVGFVAIIVGAILIAG
jgi:drug/metabolite transporter (DMT)-like permease